MNQKVDPWQEKALDTNLLLMALDNSSTHVESKPQAFCWD